MTKTQLRNIYKAKRNAITPKEKLKLDDLLLLQFQQLNFSDLQSVLSFWPINNLNEPNTHLFTSYLRHMIPALQLAYPLTQFSSQTMQAIEINEDTSYTTNQYGITEPKEGKLLAPNEIDLVIVPLLIFDEQGYRVGYGKGFYDKYLALCHEETVTIGFSYFNAVDKIDDTNHFDVPLNYCITPESIYEF
jgi:5-formyltetrahydrofolate cyclo-ligase